jgi:hypothetical protein
MLFGAVAAFQWGVGVDPSSPISLMTKIVILWFLQGQPVLNSVLAGWAAYN